MVEIAIVLVIIGLLLGGILKGQELINNAKVRAMADRQSTLKVAWFSFIDRYQGLPGDFVNAQQHIVGAGNGDGDGVIQFTESAVALQHLTGAGYLRCPQCTATLPMSPNALNSLQNSYGGVMSIWSDGVFYAAVGGHNGRRRLQIHTGPRIPSNILGELDRKLDDGIANMGDVVFNQWDPVGVGGTARVGQCTTSSQTAQVGGALNTTGPIWWRHAAASPVVEQNCGASITI